MESRVTFFLADCEETVAPPFILAYIVSVAELAALAGRAIAETNKMQARHMVSNRLIFIPVYTSFLFSITK